MAGRAAVTSVKPLIRWIEGRDGDVNDPQMANGAMAATWFNQDGCPWFYGDQFAVEFQVTVTFQHQINLGHALVIMNPGLRPNLDLVDRGGRVLRRQKGPPRQSARAGDGRDLIQLRKEIVGHGAIARVASEVASRRDKCNALCSPCVPQQFSF